MSEIFVDSSQANMLLDLLRANEASPVEQEDPLGVNEAVEKVSAHFKEMITAMLGQRLSAKVRSVQLLDGPWLEPATDDQGCVTISAKGGKPFLYLGMRNEQLRVLSGLLLGGVPTGASKNETPLTKSEKKILCIVADRLAQKLYTSRDSLEAMPLPGSARACEPVQALDQLETGQELVQLVVDTSCGGANFRLTLLFAMEVLQPAVEPVARDTQSADDETPVHRHVVRGGVDLGLVPSSSTCELVSVELSLSQLRRLKAGELLPVETPIRNVRLLDADGSPFLAGRLVPARNNKLQIIAARDRDRAHGEVVR